MPALVSTRLLLLVGESLPKQKFSHVSKRSWFHGSVRFFSRVDFDRGPLTMASIGFRGESETETQKPISKNKERRSSIVVPKSIGFTGELETETQKPISKNKERRSSIVVPKSNVKTLGSNEIKPAGPKKSLSIDSALFTAKSFSELDIPPLLLQRLESEGFNAPTDVQSAALPTILKKHDVVIQSYTGSGKTLAYVLPILCEVGPLKKKSPEGADKAEVEAVIVAPSRELGMQIVREVEKLLGPENKRAVQQLVGGANRSRQEEALKKNKPSIVVGTPGRIAEISAAGKLHTHGCRYLVLDEVDQLLSFNFREDMHRIVEHVGRKAGADPRALKDQVAKRVERQLIMVSATVPFSVIRAARSWGCDPLLVQAKKVVPLEAIPSSGPVNLSSASGSSPDPVQVRATVESLPPGLKHYYCVAKRQHKVDTLRRCVHALEANCVIAFMNNSKQLKDAVHKLQARGMEAAELHGELGKLARSTTMRNFKNGKVRVLVTNELSARGLDVAECDLVVNIDLPTDTIHYAHRAGRAGRLGRKGDVVSICEESEVFVVKKLQKQLGIPIAACDLADGRLTLNAEEDRASRAASSLRHSNGENAGREQV